MTNFEIDKAQQKKRIDEMSLEAYAARYYVFHRTSCDCCAYKQLAVCGLECEHDFEEWLKQEVRE